MVALALGATGAVGKAKAPSPRIPSCAHFSVAQLGRYVNIHPLVLESRTGNLCSWLVTETTRYDLLLQIQVVPATNALYRKWYLNDYFAAQKHGRQLHNIPRAGGLMFHATATLSSSSLPACTAAQKTLPPLGPPACNGQPAQFWDNVVGFIPPKPHAANGILVSLAVTAQRGDVSDSRMIALTNAILNGQVR
jgi:hypothetical protein